MSKPISVLLILLTNIICFKNIYSQDNDDKNIISYYAVGNSLDGQPLIDYKNALRFFPVFKFRDQMKYVKMTVYIGNRIYSRDAIQSEDKSFWQANLPDFQLGEAIQRLEVETKIEPDSKRLEEFNGLKENLDKQLNDAKSTLKESKDQIIKRLKTIEDSFNDYRLEDVNTNISKFSSDVNNLKINSSDKLNQLDSFLIELKSIIDRISNPPFTSNEINVKLNDLNEKLKNLKSDINTGNEMSSDLLNQNSNLKNNFDSLKLLLLNISNGDFAKDAVSSINLLIDKSLQLDSLKNNLKEELVKEMSLTYIDTALVGPQVQKSDIIITEDNKFVKILYRNYKTALRQLPALDPAEKMGIFRLRYVPFPIVGNKLYRPISNNSVTVFEIGLGFGNVAVSGDDFVKPTLSFDRLGVAFAISEKLFSSEAEIMALALTYDFNVYGSIGAGLNFSDPEGNSKPKTYFSFGINKKAFELLVLSLGKIFGAN